MIPMHWNAQVVPVTPHSPELRPTDVEVWVGGMLRGTEARAVEAAVTRGAMARAGRGAVGHQTRLLAAVLPSGSIQIQFGSEGLADVNVHVPLDHVVQRFELHLETNRECEFVLRNRHR